MTKQGLSCIMNYGNIKQKISYVLKIIERGVIIMGDSQGKHFSITDPKGINTVIYKINETEKIFIPDNELLEIIDMFLTTPFSNAERHVRRVNKITAYENGK